jgi:hypothetical protein
MYKEEKEFITFVVCVWLHKPGSNHLNKFITGGSLKDITNVSKICITYKLYVMALKTEEQIYKYNNFFRKKCRKVIFLKIDIDSFPCEICKIYLLDWSLTSTSVTSRNFGAEKSSFSFEDLFNKSNLFMPSFVRY